MDIATTSSKNRQKISIFLYQFGIYFRSLQIKFKQNVYLLEMRLFLMRLKKKQCLLSKITLSAHQTGQQCLKKVSETKKQISMCGVWYLYFWLKIISFSIIYL